MVQNTILEKKHYYMQILANADLLRKNAEVENAEDLLPAQQLDEVLGIWRYTFVGLLREGLIYDYIKNNNNDESKDIVRLTLDNVQFDCPVLALKAILKEDYDKLIIPTNNIIVEDFSIITPNENNSKKDKKSKSELALEKELTTIKKKTTEEIEKLSYEANHDAATGAKNKRAFIDISNSLKDETEYVLVSIDVNNLKHINDTYGHSVGDLLILTISKELINHFPHCVYRIGGDEFVLIINNKNIEEITQELLNIKEVLSNKNDDFIYSFAYGLAKRSDYSSFDETLKNADNSMYENKKAYKEKTNIQIIDERMPILSNPVSENINEIEEDSSNIKTEYNNIFEKFKDINTFVYDAYDLSILPPGGSVGEKMKALVAPLYISENDTHPEIMVMLTDKLGQRQTYVSRDGLASIKAKFNENELLIRGSFANGEFQSYIMPAGATMAMGFNINKNAVNEKRSKNKSLTSYGHIVFEQFGYKFHIVPISLANDENGLAPCLTLVEDMKTQERTLLTSSTNNFTVFTTVEGVIYQILTYWQDNILCAEVLQA